MCGILITVGGTTRHCWIENESSSLPEWLQRRGPDHSGCTGSASEPYGRSTTMHASVLQMREALVPQPVRLRDDDDESYLAWNGELYQIVNEAGDALQNVHSGIVSDTDLVASMIRQALPLQTTKSGITTVTDTAQSIATTLARFVNAEFAMCILTETTVYYARDGKRSLLVSQQDDLWQLASVATTSSMDTDMVWTEVEPGFVYAYCLETQTTVQVPCQAMLAPISSCHCTVPTNITAASLRLHDLLLQAVQRRCGCEDTSILFSGGLDSTVLAALALQCVDSVTLLTVSFVNDDNDTSQAADSLLAMQSADELRQLYPDKQIRFVHRIVDWNEIAAQEQRIRALIHPKCSVMDLNIATALWFAATATSNDTKSPTNNNRPLPPRVLLSGLGADELAGGYGRHRKAYERGGKQVLRQELDLDIDRLWDRNLGRDDRVLGDSSKEVRFPFLDTHVMEYLRHTVPLDCLVDYALPPGYGDKRIIRLVGERLGLKTAAFAVKRAIQFGSRIAHVSDKRRFGSRRKAAGQTAASEGI